MVTRLSLVLLVLVALAAPAAAQGKGPKRYAVTTYRAIVVTREVLVKQGFEVVRVEDRGPVHIVWYRSGSMGRGRGKGKLVRLVIRRVEGRVVFEETPPAILVDIDVKLRIP